MKYFIDTEFLEGTQTKRFLGFPVGVTKPTIDLISIGIVAEDGREYYAISKDFNLREAWNRWQPRTGEGDRNNIEPKDYWIRENVLRPIFEELKVKEYGGTIVRNFGYQNFKWLINEYGKTNQQIAEEIKDFCLDNVQVYKSPDGNYVGGVDPYKGKPVFYGYFADYDWVAFCWLFGKMNNLPKGFPMYCVDLKQILEEKAKEKKSEWFKDKVQVYQDFNMVDHIKALPDYPKQTNEHNALADARWNKRLYEFLNTF